MISGANFLVRSFLDAQTTLLVLLGRLALSSVIRQAHAEGNEMAMAPRDLPTTGYAIEVDGRLKAEFETEDGVRAAAQELKRRFPMLRVRIYKAQAREEVQLSRN